MQNMHPPPPGQQQQQQPQQQRLPPPGVPGATAPPPPPPGMGVPPPIPPGALPPGAHPNTGAPNHNHHNITDPNVANQVAIPGQFTRQQLQENLGHIEWHIKWCRHIITEAENFYSHEPFSVLRGWEGMLSATSVKPKGEAPRPFQNSNYAAQPVRRDELEDPTRKQLFADRTIIYPDSQLLNPTFAPPPAATQQQQQHQEPVFNTMPVKRKEY
eukprot:UN07377